MNQRKHGLSDPEYAAFAWARYMRLMRWILVAAIVAVAGAILYLRHVGGALPLHMLIATIAGVSFTVLLGGALMGLVFLSSGTGHDEDAAGPPDSM